MGTSSVPDLAEDTGVLSSNFSLLRLFLPISMAQHPTPLSSPTMVPSSRSEKLLRDALLRDERERQQLSMPPVPTSANPLLTPPAPRRRHSHATTSSYSASASTTREDYTRGSFLFRTAMSNPRSPSPSPSSFSQGREAVRDRGVSPVRKTLFYGGADVEGNNGPQRRQSLDQQQQQQRSTKHHPRHSSTSPSSSPSRRSSASTSPSPSPLHMRNHQDGLGLSSPNAHTTSPVTNPNMPSINGASTHRNLSGTPSRYGSAYPSQRQGEPLQLTPHEQVLRARLERTLVANNDSGMMTRGDETEARDEQGGWPWRRGRQSTGGSVGGSGSMISASVNMVVTASSLTSNSSHSQPRSTSQSQFNYPQTPQSHSRIYNPLHNRTAQSATIGNQHGRGPYYSPSSPHSLFSAPSLTRSRSKTDPNRPVPQPHVNANSPRRSSVAPTSSNRSGVGSEPGSKRSGSKSARKSGGIPPLPLSLADTGEAEEELRLPTPPPTPPFMNRVPTGVGYVPSPYKTATGTPVNPGPGGTPTRIPVRTQTQKTQRKKEAGLEMRRPTQAQGPLRPLVLPPGEQGRASQQRQGGEPRQRDATITQQSLARLAKSPNSELKSDGHSLASTESHSTGASADSGSGSSGSHSPHSQSGYACDACASSHSSLDDVYAHRLVHPHSDEHSSPHGTKTFNARKASTQCRAIQGYVSFASVEGLGEPPSLVGDEDSDGFEEGVGRGRGGKAPFLPLGVWSAALGWKKFLGVGGTGVGGQEQGVVV